MNKAQLVEAVAKERGVPVTKAAPFVDSVLDAIVREVTNGGNVSVTGFGVFESVERAARLARNPQTGEPHHVPARWVPRFRPGQGFHDLVNGDRELPDNRWAIAKAPKGTFGGAK